MAKSVTHPTTSVSRIGKLMTAHLKLTAALMLALLLNACASVPNGPSSMALPGTGKDFEQFRLDDASCKQFAHDQIGGTTANMAGNDSFARSAALGTTLGAVVGAAAGGGRGAGIGAATGLLAGSVIGADEASMSSYGTQNRYDDAYIQCMYAKGERVPVSGRVIQQQPAPKQPPSAPAPYFPPPPPPGYVPPDAPR